MVKTLVRNKEFRLSLLFLLVIILITFIDIIIDLQEGVSLSHISHEILILLFSLVLVFFEIRIIFNKNKQIELMGEELKNLHQEKEAFRLKVVDHASAFSKAIDEQLDQWGLTQSEKDVALLLIKGLSMKEIADVRHSQESTVRQQAMGIYKKSKLEGRQQLAAFFLEDIL